MRKIKLEQGITLIALIITVIVMIILAFVTMNAFIGDNGIFRKTEEAAKIYKNAAEEEIGNLNKLTEEYDKIKDKTDSKIKLAINFIDKNTKEAIRGEGYTGEVFISIYTDSYGSNLLKQIKMEKDTLERYSCTSKEELATGVYYIRLDSAPNGYNVPYEIIEKEIKAGVLPNIWEIEIEEGMLLPTWNEPTLSGDAGDNILDFEKEVSLLVELDNEQYKDELVYDLYEIAKFEQGSDKYDPTSGKYIYNEPFLSLGLAEISKDSFYDFETTSKIMTAIKEHNIEPCVSSYPCKEKAILAKDTCYFIWPKNIETADYVLEFYPRILPITLRSGYDFVLNLCSAFNEIDKYVELKIENEIENPNLKGGETFVYQITGYNQEEEIYIQYASMQWDLQTSTTKQTKIKTVKVPIAESIKVKQVYSGTCFRLTSKEEIVMDNSNTNYIASFSNRVKRSTLTGDSIAGLFTYKEGEWSWKKTEFSNSRPVRLSMENPASWAINATVTIEDFETQSEFYVRFKAFADVELLIEDALGTWKLREDGYYYYIDSINPNNQTEPIKVKFNIMEEAKEEEEIQFVMISEFTIVQHAQDGTPYADWEASFEL